MSKISLEPLGGFQSLTLMLSFVVFSLCLLGSPAEAHPLPASANFEFSSSSKDQNVKKENTMHLMEGLIAALKPHSQIDCDLCTLAISQVRKFIEQNATFDDMVAFFIKFCIDLKIQDENVCTSIVPLFAPEVSVDE
jgi:hypothetical protein